jgi:hypothetical protein
MPAPSLFPPRRELLINFDWTDIASATGYIEYDGLSQTDSAATDLTLVESDVATTIAPATGTTITGTQSDANVFTKILDKDFDAPEFQLPRKIKGKMYIRCGLWFDWVNGGAGAGSDTFEYYLKIRLRKWDGSSETEVALVQTETFSNNSDTEHEISLNLDVPLTLYKKGEQIRVTFEGWVKSLEDGPDEDLGNLSVAIDPNNGAITNFTAGNTRLVLEIPFRIEQ